MGRSRDIAKFLSTTETENTDNNALLHTGSNVGVDSAQVQNIGLSSYDTLDSLPVTNLVAGQQAFVKDARRLYVSNGSGWFNTAVANATPRWDSGGEPDASYEIADSATPLVITARAIDSDNSDRNLLNQSFGTDSAQYMVDITNDSSIFTFTPRSVDSIGIEVANGNLTDSNGDFIYTFKWSDGINFVSKAVTITYNTAGNIFAFGGDRGVVATGRNLSVGFYNYNDYFNITTTGNAAEYGTPGTARSYTCGASNTTRGLTAGGFNSAFTNTADIDYYTIPTTANATSFGSLSSAKYGMQGVSNGTYAVFAGGSDNEIQYVTIDTTGNASDFGDLTAGSTPAGQHSATDGSRGVFAHGSNTDNLQYITIASPGNATDFGDFPNAGTATGASSSNATMGLFVNSGNIYKITIATTGNAVDWGYNALNLWTERTFGVISNNTRGIFAGGTQSTNGKNDIEYVTFDVPSNGTDLGDLGIARGYSSGFAGNAS